MYGSIRRPNNSQAIKGFITDTVQETLAKLSAPQVPTEKLIEGDGGALRAYNFNILNFKKH